MAAQMPTTIPTGGSENLSSTAKIMINLFQILHDAEDIANNNPAILKGTLIDGMLGQLESKLKEIRDLSSAQDNINQIVDTLQNGSKEAQQQASLFTSKQTSLNEQVKDAYKARDSLEQNLGKSKEVFEEMIGVILSKLQKVRSPSSEDDQKDRSLSMEITGQFDTAQKNTEKLNVQVEKFVNDCNALNVQLDSLHRSLFAALPTQDKNKVPPPRLASSDATTPRQGS